MTGCFSPSFVIAGLNGASTTRPVGRAGSTAPKRRAREADGRGVIRAGRNKHGSALLDIPRHIIEIDHRQHRTALIAVEDDQVELGELFGEEFARRESDERKLVDGRAIVLLGRTQNREMNEIDRGIRAKQIAPGALAAWGSPETSRTRRFSRTPCAWITVLLLMVVSSPGSGFNSTSTMFGPARSKRRLDGHGLAIGSLYDFRRPRMRGGS